MKPLSVDALGDDPALLKQLLRDVAAERDAAVLECGLVNKKLDDVLTEVAQLTSERDALRHKLKLRIREIYGPSSEKLTDKQLHLFLSRVEQIQDDAAKQKQQDEQEAQGVKVGAHTRAKHVIKPFPADLPRKEVVIDVPDEQKLCPCCNKPRVEVHCHEREVIEITPAQVTVVVYKRPVYLCVCSPERETVSAPAPQLALGKARAGASVLAMIAVSKFADHAPLYRQEGMLARSGLDLSRSTMCGWLAAGADLIRPLVELMQRRILASRVIQTDDTPVPTLGLIIRKTKEARMWSYVGDRVNPYVVYDFTVSREGRWVQKWLGEYRGDLQSDAYICYEVLEQLEKVRSFGCWAHARRKFFKNLELAKTFCTEVLEKIGKLYEIEAELRDVSWEERARVRGEKAKPILKELIDKLTADRSDYLPKSEVGRAISYVLDREATFTRYIDAGHVEIDNNACERSLRAVAVGRKNWMFAGSVFGGERAAAWFSLIGSAKLHEIEPWAYLTDVLRQLAKLGENPSDEALTPLLPDQWIAANPKYLLPVNR